MLDGGLGIAPGARDTGGAHTSGDVPDGKFPVVLPGQLADLALGLIGLVCLHPNP